MPNKYQANLGPLSKSLAGAAPGDMRERFNTLIPLDVQNSFQQKAELSVLEQDRLDQQKGLQEQRNLKLNSLKSLYRQAMPNPQFADRAASSVFDRIENAGSKQELNDIYSEIESIREKAQDNSFLFDGLETVVGLAQGLSSFGESFFRGKESLIDQKKKTLTQANADLTDISGSILPQDLFSQGISAIKEAEFTNYGKQTINQFGSPKGLYDALSKARMGTKGAYNNFDDFVKPRLEDAFATKGHYLYREGEEAPQFQQEARRAFADPTKDQTAANFKHDLEKESLSSVKSAIMGDLQTELLKPRDAVDYNPDNIKYLRNSLSIVDQRLNSLDQVYKVDKYASDAEKTLFGEGSSARRSVIKAFGDTLPGKLIQDKLFNASDFSQAVFSEAFYKPDIITYDKDNRPVMSNQFMYTKADGSRAFNWGSIPEAGGAMVAQMIPIIAGGALVEGVVSGVAAAELGAISSGAAGISRAYDALNKVSALGNELKLADRAATFASVAANTIPHFVEQEKRWGGDYVKRGLAGGIVEATAEAIGFPDVGALKMRPVTTTLASSAMKAAKLELNFGQRLGSYLNNTYQFAKLGAKQNAVEALEEEISLLGNAIVQNGIMPEEYALRDREQVTAKSLTDTLVESFAAGLIYSFGTVGAGGYAYTRPENLQRQSNWEAANNPELFIAKLQDLKDKGKISDQDFVQGMAKVRTLEGTMKSLVGFDNIRDLKTLNLDKDEQFALFTNVLRRNELLEIDLDSMSDTEKQAFANYKAGNVLAEESRKRQRLIRKQLAEFDRNPEPTKEEQKERERLTELYAKLKRGDIQYINKGSISEEDKKYFYEAGLLTDRDLQVSQEDIDKEIDSINKSILKTQKRIDRYANLTNSEKNEIIRKVYDEKIEAVLKVDSAADLVESRINLQKDLDYLRLKGEEEVPGQVEHKERLLDAYGKQMNDLVNERDEFGQNKVEQKVSNFDANTLEQAGDLFGIQEAYEYAKANKDHINSDLYTTVTENLADSNKRAQEAIAIAEPEVRTEVLTNFLDKAVAFKTNYAYNVDLVNKIFPLVEYTQEELDQAREALIQRRAQKKSQQILDTQVVEGGETEKEEQAEFSNIANQVASTPEVVSESGESNRDEMYLAGYNRMIDRAKASPLGFAKAFESAVKNRLSSVFTKNTKDYNTLINALDDLLDKKITPEEFRNIYLNVWRENKGNENKQNAVIFLKFIADRYFLNDMPADRVSSRTTTTAPITPTPTPVTPSPAKATTSKNAPTPKQGTKVDKLNNEVTQQVQARLTQLESLASPLRTVAVEYNAANQKSTDPATLRNVALIEYIATTPGVRMRVMNRKLFLLNHIVENNEAITTEAEALVEFNKIANHISENQMSLDTWNSLSDEDLDLLLAPLDLILGKNFFDKGNLRFFFTSVDAKFKGGKVYPVGTGLFVDPQVIITAVDEDGNTILKDGLPLELNFPRIEAQGFRISERVENDYEELGGDKENLRSKNQANYERMLAMTKLIKAANSFADTLPSIDFDHSVSSGVMLEAPITSYKVGSEVEVDNVQKAGIAEFKIAEDPREPIFGKNYSFRKGRVYFNNNGNPTLLTNNKIDPQEADALADLYFSEENPYFSSPKEAEEYLFNLINQVNKKDRLHFFVNEEYPGPGQFPVIIVKSTGTATGFKNEVLTKEEFAKELKNHYYKASLALMRSGEPIMRFKPSGMVTQSYAQYIKDTHNFPIQDGQVAMPVNKVIYLAPESLEKQFPEITGTAPKAPEVPKTPTPPPTAPKPVVAGVQNGVKNLSILSFDAALSAAQKSPGADYLVDPMQKVGKEFYNIALNTVLADPTKLTDIYYFKLVREPGVPAVSIERRKYDPNDPEAINASHFLGRVNVEGRDKPVTVILVDPNIPFGKTYGTPKIMATIDLANPQEAVIQIYQQFTNPTPVSTSTQSTDDRTITKRKTTKTISSEIVEKGNRKGQTRTVTQTNSIQDVEGTIVSVTEYEAKVGDTTVALGGKTMTVKEFKEEFPLDEDYQEVFEGLDDDAKITVRKVNRTPTSSRFDSIVSIMSAEFGKMDVGIKKDDVRYNEELSALGQPTQPTQPAPPKRSMSALNAMRVGEVEKVEQASDSPFSDALLNEDELRAQAKESKDACKGDLDDLA